MFCIFLALQADVHGHNIQVENIDTRWKRDKKNAKHTPCFLNPHTVFSDVEVVEDVVRL